MSLKFAEIRAKVIVIAATLLLGLGPLSWYLYNEFRTTPDDVALERSRVTDPRRDAEGNITLWKPNSYVEDEQKATWFLRGITQVIEQVGQEQWARGANNWFGAVGGTGTTCSILSPCSPQTLLQGGMTGEGPGDTFYLRGGTYTTDLTHRMYIQNIQCTALQPCYVRNYQNERVIFDCTASDLHGAGVMNSGMCTGADYTASYVLMWGIEVTQASFADARTWNSDATPASMNEPIFIGTGTGAINCIFRDQTDGYLKQAQSAVERSANLLYGNYEIFSGYAGASRGFGHNQYIKNADEKGEAGRSVIDRNIGLRAFDYGTQFYSTTDTIAYITMQNSVEGPAGHAAYPTDTWSVGGSQNPFYLGTSGCGSRGCYSTNSKNLYKAVFDHNISWGAGGMTVGGSKGSCDNIFTNNLFLHTGVAIDFTRPSQYNFGNSCNPKPPTTTPTPTRTPTPVIGGGTWAPLTISGNTFVVTPNASGGCPTGNVWCPTCSDPCAKTFTQDNYPGNTFLNGLPSTGAPLVIPYDNAYEVGRGSAYVVNYDSRANVTLPLSQMGCYANEPVLIYNWQWFDPWNTTDAPAGPVVKKQTGCADISVPTSFDWTNAPGPVGTDHLGGTPYPKPPDIGPRFVVYIMVPNWGTATTPTPTPSQTFTNTASPTKTYTPSPTFTPSKTNTPSVTPSASVTPSSTPTQSPTNTPSLTPSVTRTPTTTPSSRAFADIDVQNCTLVAPMRTQSDSTAFGGQYVDSTASGSTVPADGGTATCPFSLASPGVYRVWARVKVASGSADSMYFEFNSEGVTSSTHIFDMGEDRPCPSDPDYPGGYDQLWGQSWTWTVLKDRSQNCAGISTGTFGYERGDSTSGNPGTALPAGPNTLKIYGREVGAQIDKVYITSDFLYQPNDSALTPTPTRTPSLCKVKCRPPGRSMSLTCYVRQDGPCTNLPEVPCPCR